MRLSLVCATLVAGPLALLSLAASAQQGPPAARPPVGPLPAPAVAPAPAGTSVAVIDIAYIFKHHARFNSRMNDLKREMDQYEAYVRAEQGKLKTKSEELAAFKPQTPEYKQREMELAQLSSNLQVDVGLKRKEFLEKEARNYYDTYMEIYREVETVAQRYQIRLVLRFNGDEMKPDDRNSVMQGVGRTIVYQSNLDITAEVLQRLNAGAVSAAANPAGAAPQMPPNRPIVPQPGKAPLR